MTLEEVYNYFGGWYGIRTKVGFSLHTSDYWRRKGYVPLSSQFRIERYTKGVLVADEKDILNVTRGQ